MNATAEAYLAEYVADYDSMVASLIASGRFEFSTCPTNDVHCAPPRIASEEDGGEDGRCHPDNVYLRNLVHNQRSYMACVSFSDTFDRNTTTTTTTTKRTRHECNYFPVMIGSRLDETLCGSGADGRDVVDDDVTEELSSCESSLSSTSSTIAPPTSPPLPPGSLYRDRRLRRLLCGYFIVRGQVVNIPYLLTNNREKVHVQKQQRRRSAVVLFMYNATERGSVFKKWHHLPQLLFRDQEAKEHFGARIVAAFDPRQVLNVHPRHVVVCHEWILFNLTHARKTPIDDFENKIILSPAVMLKSLLTRTVLEGKKKNVAQMRRCIREGLFSYFLSQTAKFHNSKAKHSSQHLVMLETNNMYRRPDATQIGNTVASFYQVIRPIRKYVTINKGFPDNAKGFLCHYDVSCNIDNFAKTMALVPDVRVLCSPHDIHEAILDTLESDRTPEVRTAPATAVMEKARALPGHILLLGVLPTRYFLKVDRDEPTTRRYAKFMSLFYRLKRKFDSCVEVQFDADDTRASRISISSINGTPLKRIDDDVFGDGNSGGAGRRLYLTHWELNVLFPAAFASRSLSCLSILASPLEPHHRYEEVSKSISAISQMRSRVATAHTAHLFVLTTNCLAGVYVCNDGRLPQYDNDITTAPNQTRCCDTPVPFDGEAFHLKTLICTSPMLNEDAYAVNERLNFNLLVKNKYDLTIPYHEGLVVIRHNNKQNKMYQTVDGGGENRHRRDLLIVTLATVYSPRPITAPWSSKLALMEVDKNVYVVYKSFSHSSLLSVSLDAIETRVRISRVDSNVYVLLELEYRVPRYDGMKLSNLSGQKGLCVFTNLDKYSVGGVVPDVLVSAFSVLSRRPLIQLKELAANTVAQSNDGKARIGVCTYYLLRNQSAEFKTHCFMKLDKLMRIIMMLNDLNVSIHIKSQESEPAPFFGAQRARFIFDLYRTLRVRYVWEGKKKSKNDGDDDDADNDDITNEEMETDRANKAADYWMRRLSATRPCAAAAVESSDNNGNDDDEDDAAVADDVDMAEEDIE